MTEAPPGIDISNCSPCVVRVANRGAHRAWLGACLLPSARRVRMGRGEDPAGLRFAHRVSCSAFRGFTLIELLVVITIMGVLIGAVLTASSMLINQQRVRNTRTVLTVVNDALEQFAREQTSNPTVVKRRPVAGAANLGYASRYGNYPPDELEVFSPLGLPGTGIGTVTALVDVAAAQVFPTMTASARPGPMRHYRTGVADQDALEHRDLAAMVLAIELFSESAGQILGKLPERNRMSPGLDSKGRPLLFLDRLPFAEFQPDHDFAVTYIVDDWGTPLSYMSQRNWDPAGAPPVVPVSTNHPHWNEASTELIRLNGGKPLIFSYGPDGKEQLTKTWMNPKNGEDEAVASLIGDFETNHHKVLHPLNRDNVYLDPAFAEKLAVGLEP